MDGPGDYHIKWSQTKTNIYYHLDMESEIMIQMNLFTKQKQIHRRREWTKGERWGVEKDRSGVWDQHVHILYLT